MFFSSLTLTIYLTYATACSTTIPLSDNMTSERINKPEINKDNIQGNIWWVRPRRAFPLAYDSNIS